MPPRFGVPHLTLNRRFGSAALGDWPPPDAVFIGGGATAPG